MFVIVTSIMFFLLSIAFGFKKGGEGKVILIFCILEFFDLVYFGFGGGLGAVTVWNIILLVGIINGVIKGKGDMYLADKYDDRH